MTNFLVYNVALTMLPLALAMVIYSTSPLWTSLLAVCFLGEKLTIVEIIGMMLCFTCVVGVTLFAPKIVAEDDE